MRKRLGASDQRNRRRSVSLSPMKLRPAMEPARCEKEYAALERGSSEEPSIGSNGRRGRPGHRRWDKGGALAPRAAARIRRPGRGAVRRPRQSVAAAGSIAAAASAAALARPEPGAPHVLIIGGGGTGGALAHDLALRGLRVTLVERGEITSGTTGRHHGLLHSGAR